MRDDLREDRVFDLLLDGGLPALVGEIFEVQRIRSTAVLQDALHHNDRFFVGQGQRRRR